MSSCVPDQRHPTKRHKLLTAHLPLGGGDNTTEDLHNDNTDRQHQEPFYRNFLTQARHFSKLTYSDYSIAYA